MGRMGVFVGNLGHSDTEQETGQETGQFAILTLVLSILRGAGELAYTKHDASKQLCVTGARLTERMLCIPRYWRG